MKDVYVNVGEMTPRAVEEHLKDNHGQELVAGENAYETHAKLPHGAGVEHTHRD